MFIPTPLTRPADFPFQFTTSINFNKYPFNCMDVRQGEGVMANRDSSMSSIGIVCKCGNPNDIIASSGDRFRHHSICHDVSATTYSYYVVYIHVHLLLVMSIFNLQLTRLLQRTCDNFLWVDDHITIAEKRSLVNLERELRKLRSTPLMTSATLRICRESKFYHSV